MNAFWKNTIWYVLLSLTTIFAIVYSISKSHDKKRHFAFFISVSGLTFFIEISLFGLLKAYQYYPMIFQHISGLDDGLAGNMFSQFSIASTLMLICVFNLKCYWNFIFPVIYGLIEELFIYLGIYEHYWYRTWMTVTGLIILTYFVRFIYYRTFNKPEKVLQYFLIFTAVFVPHTIFITWPFKLFGYPAFGFLFRNHDISDMVTFSINFMVLSVIIIAAWFRRLNRRQHAVIIIVFFAVYCLFYLLNFFLYKHIGTLIAFATAQILGMYLFVMVFDRLYGYEKIENGGLLRSAYY